MYIVYSYIIWSGRASLNDDAFKERFACVGYGNNNTERELLTLVFFVLSDLKRIDVTSSFAVR